MRKFKPYHYKECGLDHVVLLNGYAIDKDGSLFIEDIHGLHKAIAESCVFSPEKLKGKQIRFLRHYLDWSQKGLGENIGVDYQSVLRWEKGKTRITKTADKFLRAIVFEYIHGDRRMIDLIDRLSDRDNNRPSREGEFSLTEEGWAKVA